MLLAAGCGSDVPGSRVAVQTTGVKDVLQSKMAEEDMRASSASEEVPLVSDEENAVSEPLRETSFGSDIADAEVDIDLTVDNADLIYAEVYAMMYTPEEYTGKTVKMKGQFVFYYDEKKDQYYYACLIKDAMTSTDISRATWRSRPSRTLSRTPFPPPGKRSDTAATSM